MREKTLEQPASEPSKPCLDENARLQALRRHGNFALAYSATFQPDMEYFGDEDGFLAYKRIGGTAFVLSNPVGPLKNCDNLIRRFTDQRRDVCFWQTSRPVAEILAKNGFCVNVLGIETRIELGGYDFDGPGKRNFRRALNRAARRGYQTAERSVASLDPDALKDVSERWRRTRRVKNREMTFLTRPAILDDEIDVRKFFVFDPEGRLQAFAFFDPIYERGTVLGYLCSAKRWLPDADSLVGYAILHRAIRTFQDEGKEILSLGLSPLCGIEDSGLTCNRLMSLGFRLAYRSSLFNKFVYSVQGFAAHKRAFQGTVEKTYCAFKGHSTLSQLIKMPRACNLA
jgi:lysylphosphatidylglycerol synthetase-like protein (DUF2156 family)